MKSFKAKIIDPVGLHARPATLIVSAAGKFKSDLKIHSNGKTGNLKSIMNIMALGIKNGQEIEVTADGHDEENAIQTLHSLMKTNKLV